MTGGRRISSRSSSPLSRLCFYELRHDFPTGFHKEAVTLISCSPAEGGEQSEIRSQMKYFVTKLSFFLRTGAETFPMPSGLKCVRTPPICKNYNQSGKMDNFISPVLSHNIYKIYGFIGFTCPLKSCSGP